MAFNDDIQNDEERIKNYHKCGLFLTNAGIQNLKLAIYIGIILLLWTATKIVGK